MMGDPKRSHRTIVKNTKNPRPMNSALPQGRACGAVAEGQRAADPPAAAFEKQEPAPPAQSSKPLSIRLTPIKSTVGPVTKGGKMRLRISIETNERPISRRAQRQDVPKIAP